MQAKLNDSPQVIGPGRPKLLDLFGGSGAWSDPWRETHEVHIVDMKNGIDVGLWKPQYEYDVVLAAIPCTEFASSGARWWKKKKPELLAQALQLVEATYDIITDLQPRVWAVENPVGRLRRYIGNPVMMFDPCDYGDPYFKRTLLWGKFKRPEMNPVFPSLGSKMHLVPPGPMRAEIRSITPPGFAFAFWKANVQQ